jgi:hypothetical protein
MATGTPADEASTSTLLAVMHLRFHRGGVNSNMACECRADEPPRWSAATSACTGRIMAREDTTHTKGMKMMSTSSQPI